MDRLQEQEKQPHIQKLQKLLRGVTLETKKDHEWQVMQNTIFAQLDDLEKKESSLKENIFNSISRYFPKKLPALASAACIVILCAAGVFYTKYHTFFPKPLGASKILGIKGTVTFKKSLTDTPEKMTETGSISQTPMLFNNQVFKTSENSSLIVLIDKGSSFLLSEKTKLTATKANERDIELYLQSGSILASVSKRTENQSFTIRTPDAQCKVIGTIFSVSAIPDRNNTNVTNLTVVEGEVEIIDHKDPTIHGVVKGGETVSLQSSALSKPKQISDDQLNINSITLLKLALQIGNEETANTGLLDISSNPSGAKVFIQDVFIGNTPMALKYPEGTYILKLALDEHSPWQKEITLQRLNSLFISALFEKVKSSDSLQPVVMRRLTKRKIQAPQIQRPAIAAEQKTDSLKEPPITGFSLNPLYVEALIQMNVGEYRKALVILDSLKELPEINIPEKLKIMGKIAECYRGMGNFHNTLKNLTEQYDKSKNRTEKSNLLWEIITVKSNCLQDYEGAEKGISTYILLYPDGAWIESAYAKLGELQYITGKLSKAIGTFQYHISFSKPSNLVENSIYLLANIMRMEIKEYIMAITWYTKLIKEYPSSKYIENALFERAECFEVLDQHAKAKKDYKKYLKLFPEGHYKTLCLTRLSLYE